MSVRSENVVIETRYRIPEITFPYFPWSISASSCASPRASRIANVIAPRISRVAFRRPWPGRWTTRGSKGPAHPISVQARASRNVYSRRRRLASFTILAFHARFSFSVRGCNRPNDLARALEKGDGERDEERKRKRERESRRHKHARPPPTSRHFFRLSTRRLHFSDLRLYTAGVDEITRRFESVHVREPRRETVRIATAEGTNAARNAPHPPSLPPTWYYPLLGPSSWRKITISRGEPASTSFDDQPRNDQPLRNVARGSIASIASTLASHERVKFSSRDRIGTPLVIVPSSTPLLAVKRFSATETDSVPSAQGKHCA